MKRFLISCFCLAASTQAVADIAVTEGSGKTVATDSISSKEYQKIKVIDGATGGTAALPVDGLTGIPVRIATGSIYVSVELSTGVQVKQGTGGSNFWGVDLSTGVQARQGAGGPNFWNVDFSTGVAVKTPSVFIGVDHSTGVQVNTGNKFLGVELTTGVPQGKAGTSFWGVDFTTGVLVTGGNVKFLNVDFSTGVQVAGGHSKFLGVDHSTGVQVNTGTKFLSVELTTGVPQGKAGTSFWGVDFSTGVQVAGGHSKFLGVDHSTGVQVNTGTKYLSVETTTGVYVVGGVAEGSAATGNPLRTGVEVSSSSIPAGTANGNMQTVMGDTYGRIAVTGMPYGVISSTYGTAVSSAIYGATGANPVLVSSAGANLYTYLCGCVFTNTTATAGKITIASPVNAVTATAQASVLSLGIPASNVPSGIWPGCSEPFFRSALNSSISFIQNIAASVQAVNTYCQYFQAQ